VLFRSSVALNLQTNGHVSPLNEGNERGLSRVVPLDSYVCIVSLRQIRTVCEGKIEENVAKRHE
jgi:hypothetical protein